MKESKVIALVGMAGSGKGTCTSYMSEKYGIPLIHFGNMVYDEVQRRRLDNVKDEKFVREDMRKQEGPAVLAVHVARKTQEALDNGAKGVVLDGLYSWSEYKHLRNVFGDSLVVVAVVAPRAERYRRVLARTDNHRTYSSAKQVEDRDIAEIEGLEKGGPIAFADHTLVNSGTPQALLAQLDALLGQLGFTN